MIKEIIQRLNQKISTSKAPYMAPVQKSYLAGVADALQIVEEVASEMYEVGKRYYVIVYEDNDRRYPCVKCLELYRINETKNRMSYCFRNVATSEEYIFHNVKRLRYRAFKTLNEANEMLKHPML